MVCDSYLHLKSRWKRTISKIRGGKNIKILFKKYAKTTVTKKVWKESRNT